MADNKTLQSTAPATPAANVKLASRDVTYSGDASVDLPVGAIALVAGTDDAKTVADLSANAGAADAGTPRVIAASDSPDVAALQIMDDWDESDRAKVNVIAGQAGIAAGAGVVGATVPRVTLASDDPAVAAIGAKADASATTDTGTFSLIALVKRLLEKLTTQLPAALGAQGALKVEGVASGTAVPISAASLPLPSGAATESTLDARTGSLTETAPTTDTASSGINGRLQRIAQRLTTLLSGGLPASLAAGGGLKVEGVAGGVAVPVSAASLPLPSGAATSALQGGGLPAALAAGGGLKVEGVAGGVAQPISAASLPLPTGAATAAEQATQTASLSVMDDWDNAASDGASVSGDVAHDSPDAGEPVKIGAKAVDVGATPTVAANDRTNLYGLRNGQQLVIGGDANVLTQNLQVTDADGAQTDASIITVGAGTAIVVTAVEVAADEANTTGVSVRIGFGTANTPAADAAQVVFFHPGIVPGSFLVKGNGGGILGIGASNEDLRVTCEDPAGGSVSITITYFTVAIG